MSGTPADLSGVQVQVEHLFPAPPDAVRAVVSHLPGMAVHGPEVVTTAWDDPDQRRFTATDSRGGHTWTVPGHVVERAAPHLLRWTVLDPAHPSSTWACARRPQDEAGGLGTVVTHTFAHGPWPSLVRHRIEQDPARTAMLREDMASSLRRASAPASTGPVAQPRGAGTGPACVSRTSGARAPAGEVRHPADRRHDARVARVPDDRFPHFEVRTASELRDWLDEHAGRDEAVWLVTWKKGSPHHVTKDEVLDELVAHGWTDGVMRRLDDERVMQLVSPRRTQPWARSYKDRAERLTAQGRMHPAGTAAVELARSTGAWDAHADVDALVVPEDLTAALQAHPPAAEHFAGFPPSTRRNVLRSIASAKRPETRSKRVLLTATEAQAGRRVASNG